MLALSPKVWRDFPQHSIRPLSLFVYFFFLDSSLGKEPFWSLKSSNNSTSILIHIISEAKGFIESLACWFVKNKKSQDFSLHFRNIVYLNKMQSSRKTQAGSLLKMAKWIFLAVRILAKFSEGITLKRPGGHLNKERRVQSTCRLEFSAEIH